MSEPSNDTQISADNRTKIISKADIPAQENIDRPLTTGDVQRIKLDALTGLPTGSEPVAKPVDLGKAVVLDGQAAGELRAALEKAKKQDQEEKK